MLKLIVIICIILFYISLFVELFFYSIPSVVSTKNILNPNLNGTTYFSDRIKTYLNWSIPIKFIVFVIPLAFIYLLHFLPAYLLYDLINNDNSITNSHIICFVGIGLVIFGRFISHYYLESIKKIKSSSFKGFVTKGVFKYSRNPGLIGLYVSFLGFFIIQPHHLFLICYLVYILHMHFKIKMEEDYLSNKNGIAYTTYLQNTRRYL